MSDERKGPWHLGEHCHRGIWYSNVVLTSSIDRLRTFEVRSDDVWIVTYPKAGTHWMMEIIGLIYADGEPDKVDRSLYQSCVEMVDLAQKFPASKAEEEANPLAMTPFLDTIEKAPSPRKVLSHLRLEQLPQDMVKKAKVVYIARNPKDIILSWFNFVGKNPAMPLSFDEAIENFVNGRMHWGPWLEQLLPFWKIRDHENVTFLFYEELLKDPYKHIRQLAENIGRPLSEETLKRVVMNSTIDSMKATYKHMEETGKGHLVQAAGQFTFLHKGKIGKWKNHFTVAQNEAFDKWYAEQTADTDIEFNFD